MVAFRKYRLPDLPSLAPFVSWRDRWLLRRVVFVLHIGTLSRRLSTRSRITLEVQVRMSSILSLSISDYTGQSDPNVKQGAPWRNHHSSQQAARSSVYALPRYPTRSNSSHPVDFFVRFHVGCHVSMVDFCARSKGQSKGTQDFQWCIYHFYCLRAWFWRGFGRKHWPQACLGESHESLATR